jgi:hypothetical protein
VFSPQAGLRMHVFFISNQQHPAGLGNEHDIVGR